VWEEVHGHCSHGPEGRVAGALALVRVAAAPAAPAPAAAVARVLAGVCGRTRTPHRLVSHLACKLASCQAAGALHVRLGCLALTMSTAQCSGSMSPSVSHCPLASGVAARDHKGFLSLPPHYSFLPRCDVM
jgi:hypothetical protein